MCLPWKNDGIFTLVYVKIITYDSAVDYYIIYTYDSNNNNYTHPNLAQNGKLLKSYFQAKTLEIVLIFIAF